jgi:hypothetical protein
MITFLLYTLIAFLANACLAKIIFISIQPGQWLDKLLNWQQRLRHWDMQGKTFLVKAGGYCELCFSHLISFISFWCYLLFSKVVLNFWITAEASSIIAVIAVNIIWYLIYISIATNLSLFFITKSFKK